MGKPIKAAAGLVFRGGRFLICRRRPGSFMAGYWEFPGGKCRPGESYLKALKRELMEEFGIKPVGLRSFKTIRAKHPGRPEIMLRFFRGTLHRGRPRALEGHKFCWAPAQVLGRYKFLPADKKILQLLDKGARNG